MWAYKHIKRSVIFLICFALTVSIFTGLYVVLWQYFDVCRVQAERICMEFLSKDTLYTNQPFCPQGPLYYLFLFPWHRFLPKFFYQSVVWLTLIANSIIVLLLWRSAHDAQRSWSFVRSLFLYTPLYFFYGMQKTPEVLAAVFVLLGVHALTAKKKEYVTGLFFSLALLTKATAAAFVIASVFCVSFFPYFSSPTKKQLRNSILTMLKLLLFPVSFFLFFVLLFPQMFLYVFFAATRTTIPLSFFATVKYILLSFIHLQPFNWYVFVLLACTILLAFLIRGQLEIALAISAVGVFFLLTRSSGISASVRFLLSHGVLLFYLLYRKPLHLTPFWRKVILAFVLFLLIPKYVLVSANIGKYAMRTVLEQPYSFIPPQTGFVVKEEIEQEFLERFLSAYHPQGGGTSLLLQAPKSIDYSQFTSYYNFGLVTAKEPWENQFSHAAEQQNSYVTDLFHNKSIDLIYAGPYYWNETTYHFFANFSTDLGFSYCTAELPYFTNIIFTRNSQILVMRNKTHCETLRENVFLYFNQTLPFICKWSKYVHDVLVKSTLPHNNIYFRRECDSAIDYFALASFMLTLHDDFGSPPIPDPYTDWQQIITYWEDYRK